MNTKFWPALPLSLALATLSQAAHAANTSLSVTGLITPAACTIVVAADGTFDYGELKAYEDLNSTITSPTGLDDKTLAYTLSCDAPTSIGIKLTDSRVGTAYSPTNRTFGLGLDQSDNQIGNVTYKFNVDPLVDSQPGNMVRTVDNGTTWAQSTSPVVYNGSMDMLSYGSGTAVTNVENVSGTITAFTTIAPKADLDVTRDIRINGLAVLELIYL